MTSLRILRTLIDQGVTAITKVRTHNGAVRPEENGSVILGATDAEGFIDRMNSNTFELGRRESLRIDVFPFFCAVGRGPDSAVVAGVDDFRIGLRNGNRVAVRV